MIKSCCKMFLLGCLLAVATSLSAWPEDEPAVAPPVAPAQILGQYGPAVVLIVGVSQGQEVIQGTGFTVTPDGVIVSNYHVIKGAYPAIVKLSTGDVFDRIDVLEWDARRDIAVIKVPGFNMPTVVLGNSDEVVVGEHVVVVGNPQGLEHSISDGLISGIRKLEGYHAYQISAPISPGSSGSPVFNDNGEVIGVAFATIEEGQNLNFCIPINYVRGLLSTQRTVSLKEFAESEDTSDMLSIGVQPAMSREDALIFLGTGVTKALAAFHLTRAQVEWRTAGYKNTFWGREWKKPIIPSEGYKAQSLFHEASIILRDELSDGPKDLKLLSNDLASIAEKADRALRSVFASARKPDVQLWNQAWGDLKDAGVEFDVFMRRMEDIFDEAKSASTEVQRAFPSRLFFPSPNPGRGYLGTQVLGDEGPITVLGFSADSPAKKSLHVRDVILGILDGPQFSSVIDFAVYMNNTSPGEEVVFKILRDGKELDVKVTLGRLPK